ncbi:MAG: ATP-binding cassette domain-containing protein [Okeania sp.]|nr:ATP-binding cassette domain-containing protein [Okeania sp.]MEB3341048.1 ATP-binding cassette domain-containing protein [Okeania sp.]
MNIEVGEMIAIVGASGSGKSTLLRHINGLEKGDKSTVYVFGTILQKDNNFHSNIRKLRCQIGCIFQQFNLVKRLTVIENILVENLGLMSLVNSTLRLFTKEQKIPALAALERVGILDQAYQRKELLNFLEDNNKK